MLIKSLVIKYLFNPITTLLISLANLFGLNKTEINLYSYSLLSSTLQPHNNVYYTKPQNKIKTYTRDRIKYIQILMYFITFNPTIMLLVKSLKHIHVHQRLRQ